MNQLVIDWSHIKFYNTIMAIAAGAALLSLAHIVHALRRREKLHPRGWAINLLMLGAILTLTGMHMTLTWPMAPAYAADNISFGEPTAVLGALCLAIGAYFWRWGTAIEAAPHPAVMVATDLSQLRYLVWGIGGGLIGIGVAGPAFTLYTAPVEEPIAGLGTQWGVPWITTYSFLVLFCLTGVTALITPRMMDRAAADQPTTRIDDLALLALRGLGLAFAVIGALVYFTHIGMVVNTTGP